MIDPNRDRITSLVLAMLLGIVALLATLNPLAGQDAPPRVIEPATFLLRVDASEARETFHVYRQCGQLSRPAFMVEPAAIVDRAERVVDLCPRGMFVFSTRAWHVLIPMEPIAYRDRQGRLAGVLICLRRINDTMLVVYHDAEDGTETTVPLSCAEAGVPGWRN